MSIKNRIKKLEEVKGDDREPHIIIYTPTDSALAAKGGHKCTQEEVDAYIAKHPRESIVYWDGFKFK